MKEEVYISYAWSGSKVNGKTHLEIVDTIYKVLQKEGYKALIDKKDIQYKGNIKAFEDRLSKGDKIVLIINDRFLKSKHCMYELLKIKEHGGIADRIFPIVMADAKIYGTGKAITYITFWDKEIGKLDAKIERLKSHAHIHGPQEDLNNFTKFREIMDSITGMLSTMNTLTPEIHQGRNFKDLIRAMGGAKNKTTAKAEKDFGNRLTETRKLFESALEIVRNEITRENVKSEDILGRLDFWYNRNVKIRIFKSP